MLTPVPDRWHRCPLATDPPHVPPPTGTVPRLDRANGEALGAPASDVFRLTGPPQRHPPCQRQSLMRPRDVAIKRSPRLSQRRVFVYETTWREHERRTHAGSAIYQAPQPDSCDTSSALSRTTPRLPSPSNRHGTCQPERGTVERHLRTEWPPRCRWAG